MTNGFTVVQKGRRWAVLYPDGRLRTVVDDRAFAIEIANDHNSDLRKGHIAGYGKCKSVRSCSKNLKKGHRMGKVKCIETGVVYKNLKEASEMNNCSTKTIRKAILGGNDFKGQHWAYA